MNAKFTFNARVEKLTSNGLWSSSLKSRRGVVLANGFYEWIGEKPNRIPNFIRHSEAPVIGLAALYSWWREPQFRGNQDTDAGWHLTATIITADAVDEVLELHDRSPIPLPLPFWERWLDPTIVGDERLVDEALSAGTQEAHKLVAYPVAPLRGDGPGIIEPA
jgi:putative SOS response-associated peptidase YedK